MAASVLRIASLNAFLLARPAVRFHDQEPYSLDEYEAKTSWIGGMIERSRADIVGFQEVFHEEALRTAVAKAPRFQTAVVAAPGATNDGPKTPDGALNAPRLGLASRLPVRDLRSIHAFPEEMNDAFVARRDQAGEQVAIATGLRFFERPVLRAEIALPSGVPLTVYVVHLKSKRPVVLEGEDRADPAVRAVAVVRALVQRAAEAAALRVMLTREMADRGGAARPVAVIGDLNDGVDSVTTSLVRGEEPLPESLRALMAEPQDWQRKNRRLWDLHLYSAAEMQSGHMRGAALYTHIHFGDYQVLDHILLSQEFFPRNPGRIGEMRYLHVYNDHVADSHMTDLRSGDRTASDHGMPVAEIVLREPGGGFAPPPA